MKAWVLQGQAISGTVVKPTRIQAEREAQRQLEHLKDVPGIGLCGSTDGVVEVRTEHRTAYVHGDGYIAEVVRGH